MSQPQKISDYAEFEPKRERRTLLPITKLPIDLGADGDPTSEIRALIEQLQQSARDARVHARTAEEEKFDLAHELANAQEQIAKLTATEKELRSQFMEVTSLIRERDAALDEGERRGAALADALRKLDAAASEGAEVIRQRDESVRRLTTYMEASGEQTRLIAEMQKQVVTIRQARDSAHAQILDLTNKISRTEDELADVGYQRDAAHKAAKQATAEASNFRRQLDTITIDRDVTAQQVDQLTRELDEQRKKLLDLAEQKSAVLQAGSEHAEALSAAREQVNSLAQERDAVRGRMQEQAREIEELRQQLQTMREDHSHHSSTELAEAVEKLSVVEAQAREFRHDARNLRQQVQSLAEQLSALQKSADDAAANQAEAQARICAIAAECDVAQAALADVQEALGSAMRERDAARGRAIELEAQLAVAGAQAKTVEAISAESHGLRERLSELGTHFEKQRVETIELGAQLQSAQREIRELSASLAEARLQVKFATAASRATKNGATKMDFAGMLAPSQACSPNQIITALPNPGAELTEIESRNALNSMRRCFESFTRMPEDVGLLRELHRQIHGFSERARATGCLAIHRVCASFSELTRGLYEIPEQINPSTLRTVNQTIDFLGTLMRDRLFEQARDPAEALVYAVDDDPDNCESIRMSLETAMLRTTCAQDAATALSELAASCYDLIFLDIALPGMDGFELCSHIRQLAIHSTTPIVFLTGLASLENRTQSSLCGASDFITKPFNLHELSVKAMTVILKSQLGIQ
jgi:CheY-like chemotaxis protein/uncharacterized coiled-coil DUF342 family protein